MTKNGFAVWAALVFALALNLQGAWPGEPESQLTKGVGGGMHEDKDAATKFSNPVPVDGRAYNYGADVVSKQVMERANVAPVDPEMFWNHPMSHSDVTRAPFKGTITPQEIKDDGYFSKFWGKMKSGAGGAGPGGAGDQTWDFFGKMETMGVKLRFEESDHLLVIEDPYSQGIGQDNVPSSGTYVLQKAENSCAIKFVINAPKVPSEVWLTIPETSYRLKLSNEVGEQTAIIETKDGKLKGSDSCGKEVWYPTENDKYWQPGKYRVKIEATVSSKIISDIYEKEELLSIEPLLHKNSLLPESVETQGFCPYTDVVKNFAPIRSVELWSKKKTNYNTAYGFGFKCDFNYNLYDLTFTTAGGDLTREVSYEIADRDNFQKKGEGKILEWEGFSNSNISDKDKDKVNEVRNLLRHYCTLCPIDIVKPAEDYIVKISATCADDHKQTQRFEIHRLKVIYKY